MIQVLNEEFELSRRLAALKLLDETCSIIVGGSLARGLFDAFSDIDVCIVAKQSDGCAALLHALKSCGIDRSAITTGLRHLVWRASRIDPAEPRIEIRCTSLPIVLSAVHSLLSLRDTSDSTLDFIHNIESGIYVKDGCDIRRRLVNLEIDARHQKQIYSRCLQNLIDPGLEADIRRGDVMQYFAALNVYSRVYLTSVAIWNNRLSIGVKHWRRTLDSLAYRDAVVERLLADCYSRPDYAACQHLLVQLRALLHARLGDLS